MLTKSNVEEILEDNNIWWVFSDINDRLYINGFRYTIGRFLIMLDNVISITKKYNEQPRQLKDLLKAKSLLSRD